MATNSGFSSGLVTLGTVNSPTSGSAVSVSSLSKALTTSVGSLYFRARVSDNPPTSTGISSATVNGSTLSITFVNPIYRGVVDSSKVGSLTSDDITGLSGCVTAKGGTTAAAGKVIESKGTKNYFYVTSSTQVAVFAYPSTYGKLSSIKDQNNFAQDWGTPQTVSVTTNTGAVNYYVYTSGAASSDGVGFGYTFTF
jgi:hypothetical protein